MAGIKDAQFRQAERGEDINPTLACLTKQPDNFISSKQFAKKYGLELRKLPPACRAKALIAELREVEREAHPGVMVNRWFILDIPPQEHPEYQDYCIKVRQNYQNEPIRDSLRIHAFEYLQRFNEARMNLPQSDFTGSELAAMLKVRRMTITRWIEIGEEGFGRLPKINFPDDKAEKYGRIDFFIRQEDIIRFLRGELAMPTTKFRTVSDQIAHTNAEEIAEKHGYFVFDRVKTYPINFEGFMSWAEDNVLRYDKATDAWIPFRAIQMQRDFFREVFSLNKDGTFRYKFIRVCRPRGDMKSFDAILIFLFRFFNMRRQKILLAANSKDQSDYTLYDEARDIILNSPNLANTPGLEVREKEVRLMAGKTERFSRIQSVASKQGSLSNADCIVFSEIHKMQDQAFIVELEGSIRQVKNAMSIIESTVSRVGTYYHRQFEAYNEGKSPIMYFQYYCDKHHNPNMTQDELNHYHASFFPEEYDMFFRNRWGDAGSGVFSTAQIMKIGIIGAGEDKVATPEMNDVVAQLVERKAFLAKLRGATDTLALEQEISQLQSRLKRTDKLYRLPANRETLDRLRQEYQTDFVIGMGLDRAEQMVRYSDRTALVTVARGFLSFEASIYFVLDIFMPDNPSMRNITEHIFRTMDEFGWIDQIDIEKPQGMDLESWCQEQGISANLVHPSFEHQKEMFRELYDAIYHGRLKCPSVPLWVDDKGNIYPTIPPDGMEDILRTELAVFEHSPKVEGVKAGFFGSAFKKNNKNRRTKLGEAKDDVVFALAHAVYASKRGDIPAGASDTVFSSAQVEMGVIGDYGQRRAVLI